MKAIRFVLGKIILFLDRTFVPQGIVRTAGEQARVNEETKSMSLYELSTCPFCVKVRRELKRLSLHIPLKNVGTDAAALKVLIAEGGKDQVPCLRIDRGAGKVEWLYESSDIVSFLQSQFKG